MAAKRAHPLEAATDQMKTELDPKGTFMQSVVREVWGDKPPFSVTLSPQEQQRLVTFALSTPFGRQDMIARYGKDKVMELAAKYGVQMPSDMPAEGGSEVDANG